MALSLFNPVILVSVAVYSLLSTSAAAVIKQQSPDVYHLDGIGTFSNYVKFVFDGRSLPDGLQASNDSIDDMTDNPAALYNHYFTPENVRVEDGFLNLIVPGGQDTSPILCGEVSTVERDILYASVRVNAILSKEPGVVNGLFFYHDDCQEIDIEYLPDPKSGSNPQDGSPPPLAYTNQATNCNHSENTYVTAPAPIDVSADVHEYRIDWIPGQTSFYTDGVFQASFNGNVPTVGGEWVFNLWTNGDPGFSVGPPAKTAILQIDNIVMYYNTSADLNSTSTGGDDGGDNRQDDDNGDNGSDGDKGDDRDGRDDGNDRDY